MHRPEPLLEVAIDLLEQQIVDVETFRRQYDRRCVPTSECRDERPARNCKTKTEMIRMQTRDMAALREELHERR